MIFGSLVKKYVLTPFASGSLLKNDIPQTRTTGLANNRATWSEGFPEITMKPILKDENNVLTSDSGIPASGYDFNGVLNVVSNEIYNQKLLGGAYNDWDTNVVSQYGGYPKGAIVNYPVGDATSKQQYISLVDNNTSKPDSGTEWRNVIVQRRMAYEEPREITLISTNTPRPNYDIYLSRDPTSFDAVMVLAGGDDYQVASPIIFYKWQLQFFVRSYPNNKLNLNYDASHYYDMWMWSMGDKIWRVWKENSVVIAVYGINW